MGAPRVDGCGGSWAGVVAAVRVSMGGGRIGTATREEVDELVAFDREEELDALRWTEGDVGRRGKGG